MFIEIPASARSIVKRKLVHGVGINDAAYTIRPTINNKKEICPFYKKWSGMMKRCYSKKFTDVNPTYSDCRVCTEWLTFSNFKSWMKNQYWEGCDLDKDIISPGNKLYCPNMCCFVTHSLNSLLCDSGAIRGSYKKGVCWDESRGKYKAYINNNGRLTHIGLFITESLAYAAYSEVKTSLILQAASEQTDPRIANGLRLHAELLNKH